MHACPGKLPVPGHGQLFRLPVFPRHELVLYAPNFSVSACMAAVVTSLFTDISPYIGFQTWYYSLL